MNFVKIGFATILLLACACDKPDDKMQSTGSMASASSMATTNMAPTMAPSSMAPSSMAPSSMAPTMATAGGMAGTHDMAMAGDGGAMMAPAMGGAATAASGSSPRMNDKPPRMSASATHM